MSDHERSGVRPEEPGSVQPGRRAFLRFGTGCALPLVVGGALNAARAAAAPPADPPATDAVLDHIRQEAVRVYHGMSGEAGPRGEHVRRLAANLELLGAYLQAREDGARIDSAFRRRVHEQGREATVRQLMAGYGDLAVEAALEHGVVSRVACDTQGALAALDRVARGGVVATLRGQKAGLSRLAARVDRANLERERTTALRAVRQKPGDDFLGFPPDPPTGDMTWCEFLTTLVRAVQTTAAILGVIGFGAAAGALAVSTEVLELIKLSVCDQNVVP
jgi:hypothetical protein